MSQTVTNGQISALATLISDAAKVVEANFAKSAQPEFYEPSCLNVVLAFKIPDILQEKPDGMQISEIAEKSGIEMEHRFAVPAPDLDFLYTDECFYWSVSLTEVLGDKEWGHSYAPNYTPFNRSTGYPGPAFSYLEQDEPKCNERRARFGIGMIAWGAAIESHNVVTAFPWNQLPEGASVCDIGGRIGVITMMLAKAYPKLKFVLQDLPGCIDQAKDDIWPQQCPEAIAEGRIEFEASDFMAGPPVMGCDVYYLKNIVHDWPEAECIKISSNVREAMSPHSRVLVQEHILQHASRHGQSDFIQAPEPLLPNFGAGRIRQYNLDLDMMIALNSQERHLADFIRLGEAADLKFVKLWDLGETGLIEYQLPANRV